jgi:hypothetical protein
MLAMRRAWSDVSCRFQSHCVFLAFACIPANIDFKMEPDTLT